MRTERSAGGWRLAVGGSRLAAGGRRPARGRGAAFTLLELIVAFAILALFVLPMLQIVASARVRAMKVARERQVRDLAYRKLFDCIYSLELMQSGTFDAEGHPDWQWTIVPPRPVNQGEQPLLEFTIQVTVPGMGPVASGMGGSGMAGGSSYAPGDGGSPPGFQMSVWAFPTGEWLHWYEDMKALQAQGYDPGLLQSPLGGTPGF